MSKNKLAHDVADDLKQSRLRQVAGEFTTSLAEIVALWPELPEHIKVAIIRVNAASTGTTSGFALVRRRRCNGLTNTASCKG